MVSWLAEVLASCDCEYAQQGRACMESVEGSGTEVPPVIVNVKFVARPVPSYNSGREVLDPDPFCSRTNLRHSPGMLASARGKAK